MNTLLNGIVVTVNPGAGWQRIAAQRPSLGRVLALHTVPYALIPAVCWYFGVTRQGWTVAGDPVRLTPESALPMCVLF
ncbi:MAG: hypothetical protein RIE74_06905, partial [Pseudomonadales bacterium]